MWVQIQISVHTKDEDFLVIGLRIGISGSLARQDDYRTVDGGTCPIAVSVPPQSTFFVRELDLVSEIRSGSNWTLCDVFRTIGPWISRLLYSVPS